METRDRRTVHAIPAPVETTLLHLVQVVSEVSRNEREVVETVRSLLQSGRVKLTGSFRDDPPVH